MTREKAKEYVKNQLRSYLAHLGVDDGRPFICMNPEHPDRNASMSYDKRRNKVHCFGCGADYDTFDLYGANAGISNKKELFAEVYRYFGITLTAETGENPNAHDAHKAPREQATQTTVDIRPKSSAQASTDMSMYREFSVYRNNLHASTDAVAYLVQRGLSSSTWEAHGIGYIPEFKTKTDSGEPVSWRVLCIPSDGGSYTARNIDPSTENNRIRKRGRSKLYNTKALDSGAPVFVVEGEFDVLSFSEIGYLSVGLGSTANIHTFVSAVRGRTGKLLLALDSDSGGRRATDALACELVSERVPFAVVDVNGDYKDPNERLVRDRNGFMDDVRRAYETHDAQEEHDAQSTCISTAPASYRSTSAAGFLQEFLGGISARVDTPYISTGFPHMDEILDGGLYEGLHVLGAISSLGKTTFVLQLCDRIARHGTDVLFFSLEMARTELMAKSISRETFEISREPTLAKTTRGITTASRHGTYCDRERDIISQALSAYRTYASNLFIHEGCADVGTRAIRTAVETHLAETGCVPVVVIDYLQLLSPHNPRATDKQNMDKSVMELKRISRDYKAVVFAISSFNRQNYKESVTMEAFKESGAIEYSSDVLIGMQAKGAGTPSFDIDKAKLRNPREVELRILKNRNGAAGGVLSYQYYPLFNFFAEE